MEWPKGISLRKYAWLKNECLFYTFKLKARLNVDLIIFGFLLQPPHWKNTRKSGQKKEFFEFNFSNTFAQAQAGGETKE